MTGTLLHVSASANAEASHSARIGQRLVAQLCRDGQTRVITRDLGRAPPPHPDRAFVTACLAPDAERGAAERTILHLSEMLIAELESADQVVIDTPMHNFTVPSSLKSWIDHVVRTGRTFHGTQAGKIGTLHDRPVYLVIACGGSVADASDGHMERGQPDFLTPYLRQVLAIIGLRDLRVLRLDRLRRGDTAIAQAEALAAAWIAAQKGI